jgi:hypothetical protein
MYMIAYKFIIALGHINRKRQYIRGSVPKHTLGGRASCLGKEIHDAQAYQRVLHVLDFDTPSHPDKQAIREG